MLEKYKENKILLNFLKYHKNIIDQKEIGKKLEMKKRDLF